VQQAKVAGCLECRVPVDRGLIDVVVPSGENGIAFHHQRTDFCPVVECPDVVPEEALCQGCAERDEFPLIGCSPE
jgi:hypothetical protein